MHFNIVLVTFSGGGSREHWNSLGVRPKSVGVGFWCVRRMAGWKCVKLCVASVVAESQPAKKNRHDHQDRQKSTLDRSNIGSMER